MRLVVLAVVAIVMASAPVSAITGRARMVRTLVDIDAIQSFIGSERISVVSAGKSVRGQQIPLVVIHDPGVPVEETRRIFIICRQHGDEPAPTEAAMALIGTYFSRPSERDLRLLKKVTLVIVPMMNPDGASRLERRNANNKDLNRDWLKQSQPETRAVARAVDIWAPSMVIDAHELDRNDHRADFVECLGRRSGVDAEVMATSLQTRSLMISNLRTHGLIVGTISVNDRNSPRLAHRYFPLMKGIPALLLESRQSGRRSYALKERVRLHVVSIMTASRCLAGESEEIRREIAEWHAARERPAPVYRGKAVQRGKTRAK